MEHDTLSGLALHHQHNARENHHIDGHVGLGVGAVGVPSIDQCTGLAAGKEQGVVIVLTGTIFAIHHDDIALDDADSAACVLAVYLEYGVAGFAAVNGHFAVAIWDSKRRKCFLVRDHFGFEPLYYVDNGSAVLFCSHLRPLLRHPDVVVEINLPAIRNFLLFCYNPGLDTIVKAVHKVRASHFVAVVDGRLRPERYWQCVFAEGTTRDPEAWSEALRSEMTAAVRIRTHDRSSAPGVFLSGGMDSSTIVSLLRSIRAEPIHTFSFRCEGKDVDESYFARVVANHYGTVHHELAFTPDLLQNLGELTASLDEPLCDIGVELGSYIMGQSASGHVQYALTGDGGDEVFAGHPVYRADDIARKFTALPAFLRSIILGAASRLPDSRRKKSLQVKARRFAYSYGFPENLRSNRWRVYYHHHELLQLFNRDHHGALEAANTFHDIYALYGSAESPDALCRNLHGDFQTLVHFHIDRLRLTRASAVGSRFPYYDYRLVEFAAAIPSELKLSRNKEKYIQWKALQGRLPDEIINRRDKVGHNVPMKRWIRESGVFETLMKDVLSEANIDNRGMFDPAFVAQLLIDHKRGAKDFSHRLYALVVLELWLQKNVD